MRTAVAALLLACRVQVAGAETGLAVAKVPLSARQQASGGTYGAYDVLGVVENPAVLITQPRAFEVNAADHYLFAAKENVIGLGVGWLTGAVDTGAWGLALVAGQVSTAGFDLVDDLGSPTGERVQPVARRVDLAGAYQRFGMAIGASIGTAAESYGSRVNGVEAGPGGMQVTGGILMPFKNGSAGASLQFPGLGTRTGAEITDSLNAGGTVMAAGLWLTGTLVIPLSRPAGPSAMLGIRWPVNDVFDLQAASNTSFATGVAPSLGTTVRAGFSLRSVGLGMDYTLEVPVVSGLGVTHLIALGWDFGDRRPPPDQAQRPEPAPAATDPGPP